MLHVTSFNSIYILANFLGEQAMRSVRWLNSDLGEIIYFQYPIKIPINVIQEGFPEPFKTTSAEYSQLTRQD